MSTVALTCTLMSACLLVYVCHTLSMSTVCLCFMSLSLHGKVRNTTVLISVLCMASAFKEIDNKNPAWWLEMLSQLSFVCMFHIRKMKHFFVSPVNRLLQEENDDLQHSLLQTAVRMECMGAEFNSNHQLLEGELQQTRVELSTLMDRFKK